MSLGAEFHDPVFGVLRQVRTGWYWDVYEGAVWLTPKHRVAFQLALYKVRLSAAEGLALAQEVYARVRGGEWEHRLTAACALLRALEQYIDNKYRENVETLARALTLTRIALDTDSTGWTLHYDSGGRLHDKPVIVYYEDDGSVDEVEFA